MKKAGVLGSTYRIGVADEATITAFTKVLGQANRNLSSWQTALGNLQANPPYFSTESLIGGSSTFNKF